jgi:hypothetical protein
MDRESEREKERERESEREREFEHANLIFYALLDYNNDSLA